MPLLPLPIGGANIACGDLPIVDDLSIAALEPLLVTEADTAPVRDAIRAGLAAMFTRYQDGTARAAMQSNVLYANGIYLDGLGADEGVFRQTTEPYTQVGDAAYRARIIVQGGTVAPAYIIAASNSVLATYGLPQITRYLESLSDRGYCKSTTYAAGSFAAYVRTGGVTCAVNPSYPDRVYPDDAAANGGASVPNRQPGGFFCFSDTIGRYFVLRVPNVTGLDGDGGFPFQPYLNSASQQVYPEFQGNGLFCSSGSVAVPNGWSFMRSNNFTSQVVYQAIVNAVSRLVGQSVRWSLVADSNLV